MTKDIGKVLRELREASGMEAKAVARSAVVSASKLSRIETGKATPAAMDVERILTAIGVSEEIRAELSEVARKAATEAVAWRLYRRMGFAQQPRRHWGRRSRDGDAEALSAVLHARLDSDPGVRTGNPCSKEPH
ncbi:MAG: helix-turn-helix domain-containing protein [Micromonosporaceae bacterium]